MFYFVLDIVGYERGVRFRFYFGDFREGVFMLKRIENIIIVS